MGSKFEKPMKQNCTMKGKIEWKPNITTSQATYCNIFKLTQIKVIIHSTVSKYSNNVAVYSNYILVYTQATLKIRSVLNYINKLLIIIWLILCFLWPYSTLREYCSQWNIIWKSFLCIQILLYYNLDMLEYTLDKTVTQLIFMFEERECHT